MFELTLACKYLIPRKRYLSVSLISTISLFVIAIVVWLTIVFFSATEGLEKRWTEKLVTVTAPVRIVPTEHYWKSYYYLIDSFSEKSHFTLKSIQDKLHSPAANPYDPERDRELPKTFPQPLLNKQGSVRDLIKEVYNVALNAKSAKKCAVSPFEVAFATATITLLREMNGLTTTRILSQPSYITNFNPNNLEYQKVLLPYTKSDLINISGHKNNLLIHEEHGKLVLAEKSPCGAGIILPKSFRDAGVLVGDKGTLSYQAINPTALSEQRLHFYVAGFYDPGIIPIGGKILLAPLSIVETLSSETAYEAIVSSGFNVSFTNTYDAHKVKNEIVENLKKTNLDTYFSVAAYDEFDFTQDLFQQLKSEKNLFSLISLIIIIVACSNIVSMLVILVHDKEKEIAIMRALGASKLSVGFIFGFSGFVMGSLGSLVGTIGAFFTIQHLSFLLGLIGKMQGFDVLNARFYGETLPSEISYTTTLFVVLATSLLSTCAGTVAAFRAARQNSAEALRAE